MRNGKSILSLFLVGLVAFAVVASGCIGGEETTTTPTETTTTPEQVTLTVIGPWSGAEFDAFKKVIDAFESKYPNIKIEYKTQRAEDLATILPLQFDSKEAPADVIAMWGWFITDMGKKGHVMELNDIINKDDYVSGVLDAVTADGKIYGAPFTAGAKPGFWYRKSFFEKHGLTPPTTWDEFVALLEKIKGIEGIKAPIVTGDSVGWPISDVTEHFLITFGGPELQYKLINGEVKFTDPQVKEIFENRIVPLLKAGYFSEPIEWTSAVTAWWNGDYALYFMGTWLTGMVDDPTDLGMFTLPGAKGMVMAPDYWMIPKYTKHPEEAKLFVKFLATEGQKIHVGTNAGKVATYKNVPIDAYWEPMRDVAKVAQGAVTVPDLDDSIGGEWQQAFWDQLKLLWVEPDRLDEILKILDEKFPKS
ncbi:ABC transporter substrate-binding protein [Palaeococcus pacificus DY20341]|uniref:ABC transporter substrate-binding protein n=1 Tax=Palaeococcus pacificus DY20341 TaxID=1343739 RepID=A0A075LXY1_9EURY|nr:ABC transporter substrate-binding protein [Palaeococcus pacificus]AIF69438.1 ABC transporter substrate-binding protein [Palaeococcus pacificus DY20341]